MGIQIDYQKKEIIIFRPTNLSHLINKINKIDSPVGWKIDRRVQASKNILKIVAGYYELTEDEIKKRSNERYITEPRQIAMYLYKKKYNQRMSLRRIGLICGGFDHATVLHAKKTVQNLIDTNKDFATKIREIDGLING